MTRGMHRVRSLPGYIVDNASENGIPPAFLASALVMESCPRSCICLLILSSPHWLRNFPVNVSASKKIV